MNVELQHIHKSFGAVHASNDINLSIPAGVIQGILGENGAGKSTLMKILSGFIQADNGTILLDEKPVIIHAPADAIQYGVGMLHQDPLDFPPLRVIDNFILGNTGGLFPDRSAAKRDFNLLAAQFGFNLNPDAYTDSLTVGERQQLEILRLLWLGARVLILDEPTTGISAAQKDKLFATLKVLASQGKTIIFVSHKLEDVESLCHRVAVLQQGKLIGTMEPPYNTEKLVEMMFGKVVTFGGRTNFTPGQSALHIENLSMEDYRLSIRKVSLDVRQCEVIGLAGMEGSGQALFLQACAGLVRPTGGHLLLKGQNLTTRSHHHFKKNGTAYLPAARLEEGLVPGLTLSEHFILAGEGQGMFVNRTEAVNQAQKLIKAFNIKGTPVSPIESLSGGNQQRALLALLREPLDLILLEHPTRGLDIESVMYIWDKLKERCQQGTSIIFISSDLDEILQYSDRILVFFAGKVSPPLNAATTSVDQLGQLIGGKGWEAISEKTEAAHA
ncbi:MAG: ATP-binding cassette domain-containing protein [Anaerolineae bacterium]|nr:ATP-binding cassette domain-containing protein [Anaerolineae bacterium]